MSEEPEQESEQAEPHDVLAAEEFGVPAPDPLLQDESPAPVPENPDDPEGQSPPHDVLAGEEFPIPAAGAGHGAAEDEGASEPPAAADGGGGRVKAAAGVLGAVAVGFAAVLGLRRRGGTDEGEAPADEGEAPADEVEGAGEPEA